MTANMPYVIQVVSTMEISMGFLVILSILLRTGPAVRAVFYWQLLRLRYPQQLSYDCFYEKLSGP